MLVLLLLRVKSAAVRTVRTGSVSISRQTDRTSQVVEQYQKKNTQTRFQQVALLTSAVLHHFPCWLRARGLWAGLYLPLPPGSSELPLIMQSSCNSIDPLGWSDPQIGNTLCWLTYQDIQNEWLKLFQGSRDIKIPPSFPSLLKYSQWDLAFAVTDDKRLSSLPVWFIERKYSKCVWFVWVAEHLLSKDFNWVSASSGVFFYFFSTCSCCNLFILTVSS